MKSKPDHKPVRVSFEDFLMRLVEERRDVPSEPLGEPTIADLIRGNGVVQGSLESVGRGITERREEIQELFEPREKRYWRGPRKPDHELKWSGGRRTPGKGRWSKKDRVRRSKKKIVLKRMHYKQLRKMYSRRYAKQKASGKINTKGVTDIVGTYEVFKRNVKRDYKRDITKQYRSEILLSGKSWETWHRSKVKKRVEELVRWDFENFSEEDWIKVWLSCGRVMNREGEEVLAFKARSKFKKGGTRIEKIDKYSPYSLRNVRVMYERRVVLYPKQGGDLNNS